MPASWHPAAVRAQAVAARTYAAYERTHRTGPLCDTTSCQVYGGYAAEHPASNAAVDATRDLALMHDGEPAFTQFSSSSGGWTSAGSMSYLVAQEDPVRRLVRQRRARLVDARPGTVRSRAPGPRSATCSRIVVLRRDGNGEWGGRVASIRIVGAAGRVTVSGDTLRSALGLRSTWVTFEVKPRTS